MSGIITDDEKRQLEIELMTVQIKKHNFDMEMELRKLTRQTVTIVISGIAAGAALLVAGGAIGRFLVFHQ